jgi:hypothetical protein
MKNYNSKIRTSGAENLCLAGSDSVAAAVGPVVSPVVESSKKAAASDSPRLASLAKEALA